MSVSLSYNIWQALPYFGILVIALCGINVFIVLGAGIVSYFIVGIATGAATVAETFSSMGGGVSGNACDDDRHHTRCFDERVYQRKRRIRVDPAVHKTQFQGQQRRTGRCCVADFADGRGDCERSRWRSLLRPIAKDISKEFDITPQRTASIMDIFSCVWQGIIPYGAQLLIASGTCGDLIAEYNPVPVLSVPAFHKCDTVHYFQEIG